MSRCELSATALSSLMKRRENVTKVNEYLQSGCQEVWLVLPESQWIMVLTGQQRFLFTMGEVVNTQTVLKGFSVAVDELLA